MRAVRENHQKQQREIQALANRLYEQYGKPLEAEHLGEFVAISRDGRTLVGQSASAVGRRARETFGRGSFVFRLGPRVVGTIPGRRISLPSATSPSLAVASAITTGSFWITASG